ncbi:MAG: 30S ribosome-binding factor RbfA [Gammaproteobacteria bacterium]
MPNKQYQRNERVADLIQRELALLIQRELKDPIFDNLMLTIAAVDVAPNLSSAKVYVTLINENEESITQALQGLNQSAQHLRKLLGKSLYMRTIPRLTFMYDYTLTQASHIDRLIEDAMIKSNKNNEEENGEDE